MLRTNRGKLEWNRDLNNDIDRVHSIVFLVERERKRDREGGRKNTKYGREGDESLKDAAFTQRGSQSRPEASSLKVCIGDVEGKEEDFREREW